MDNCDNGLLTDFESENFTFGDSVYPFNEFELLERYGIRSLGSGRLLY
jgi:hypothetical protein